VLELLPFQGVFIGGIMSQGDALGYVLLAFQAVYRVNENCQYHK
jgi:hypothetical protein